MFALKNLSRPLASRKLQIFHMDKVTMQHGVTMEPGYYTLSKKKVSQNVFVTSIQNLDDSGEIWCSILN